MKRLFPTILALILLTQPALAATDVKNDAGLSTNLVSYWELEEASGTRVDSHSSNDLTDNNTVGQGTGIQGNAADFENGNSEYLSITDGDQTGLEPANDFSIQVWYRPESFDNLGYLIIKGSDDDNEVNYRIEVNTSGEIGFFVRHAGGSYNVTGAGPLTLDEWNHIVAVKRSSGTGMEVFINGSSDTTGAGNTADALTNSDPVLIGARERPSAQNFIDGLVDEVGFWDKSLTSSEVSDLYNSGAGIPYEAAAPAETPRTHVPHPW